MDVSVFYDRDKFLRETELPFRLYLIYLVSFFIHIPARFSVLGLIRFDLVLVGVICFLIFSNKSTKGGRLDDASKYLLAIFIYSVAVLPLVEWPGSVVNNGLYEFVKGAIFYFFTVNLVFSERRLKLLLFVFISCNIFRVFEPLYLNITTGYLGSSTYLGGSDYAGRLAGAPSDTINANGLAFVIASIFPFLHYVFAPLNKKTWMLYAIIVPVLLYTMGLTLSRSGVLALGIIAFGIFIKSKRKVALLCLGVVGIFAIWSSLNDIQKDRYLSLVSEDSRQASTAQGRVEGWFTDFEVAMNRPIIGHGLGTSREANWNVAGNDRVSHILWAEIVQEIGVIGLVLFILYLKTMIMNFIEAGRLIKSRLPESHFLSRCTQAMQVWLLMNLLFSFASYGLKSYEWYLFGGLSVVLMNIIKGKVSEVSIENNGATKNDNSLAGKRFSLARRINRQG
ncbi:O-antigen ligase family protein [Marinobacter sp. GN3S48]|uniref:O-antigen ligase family protein n=1 Tax=Marinobacter sp. GN3S48 TaxID=3382302 RepID=UPI00387AB4F7